MPSLLASFLSLPLLVPSHSGPHVSLSHPFVFLSLFSLPLPTLFLTPSQDPEISGALATFMSWVDGARKLKVREWITHGASSLHACLHRLGQ